MTALAERHVIGRGTPSITSVSLIGVEKVNQDSQPHGGPARLEASSPPGSHRPTQIPYEDDRTVIVDQEQAKEETREHDVISCFGPETG
jgi:hypothetical protein